MHSTFVLVLAASLASARPLVQPRQDLGSVVGLATGLASVPEVTTLLSGATSSLPSVLGGLGGLVPIARDLQPVERNPVTSASQVRRQLDALGGILGPLTGLLGGLTGSLPGAGSLLPGATTPPAAGSPAATAPTTGSGPIDTSGLTSGLPIIA